MTIEQEAKFAAKMAMTIPGQMRESELAFLYRLARQKGPIVEIGCLHGRSTSVLMKAAEKFDAEVASIDPFMETPNTTQPSAKFWRINLKVAGLPIPHLMEMKSHEASPLYLSEIGLLFVDGGHSYEDISQDIQDWVPKVKIGGLVAFHDMYQYAIPGVARAVTEWWISTFEKGLAKWRFEGQADFLVAFRRVA
jgi:predicted O-methyltransferase YrrM